MGNSFATEWNEKGSDEMVKLSKVAYYECPECSCGIGHLCVALIKDFVGAGLKIKFEITYGAFNIFNIAVPNTFSSDFGIRNQAVGRKYIEREIGVALHRRLRQ